MKRCKNKRKLAVLGLAAAMALSLAACGEKRPSQELSLIHISEPTRRS